MKDHSSSFNQKKIIGSDPVAVKLLRDAYERMIGLSEKHPSEFEETIQEIESAYNKGTNREELRMNIVLEEAHDLLEQDEITPAQKRHLFELLEKLIFLRESDDDVSMFFDRLNQNIHSMLRLDFDNNINFPATDSSTSNLLDLISGSLMLIKEKYERAVVSNKSINKVASVNPEQFVLVTDGKGKIRFLDQNAEDFFATTLLESIHTNIQLLIPEIEDFKAVFAGIELKRQNIEITGAKGLKQSFELHVKNTQFEAETEDEIQELAFVFKKAQQSTVSSSLAREYHDRLAPLNTILGAAEILQDICVYHDEAKGCSDVIFENAQRLKEDTVDLLTSISEGKNSQEEVSLIDFNDTLAKVSKSLEFVDGRKETAINLNIEEVTEFVSQRKRIASIFQNLISNGLKYRKKSEAVESTINVTVSKTSHIEGVLIVIEDNGIGIENQELRNIFKGGYQSDTSSEGFGLGLKIVRDAVQELNGIVEMESTPGYGTTFIIQLPTSTK